MQIKQAIQGALLALCIAAPASYANDIKPGLWEFRSTHLSLGGMPDMSAQMAQLQQQMKNLPPETRKMLEQQMAANGVSLGKDGSVRSCITPEQARQDNVYAGKTEGDCTLDSVTKSGNTISGRMSCPKEQATGDFTSRVSSPEHFTTRVNLKSPRGDMQVETDARWISAQCAGNR
ncbi:DUF3617 family protein [Azoarcus communis]|uniref:DUF3617 domain-containing protein n=1 Tax=Parazoarcus communis SWub3 = DSM 12120 TaxID=1121029 RepID=A0A323UW08_9RHOO|nr:DUF3617 domain-containing protein [Parazoarcus communis]NMG50810.1 DUF3617 family protein [Parazoarcus communis]NMG72669.1 DUF3617 family protein [Parazoarcus communis SWub3 = DSM 12120]PZA15860.1 DUF3617 domain-containing protein [Azoarcus communis] [Parazoarcus communis SWub3 = DSM 12120]